MLSFEERVQEALKPERRLTPITKGFKNFQTEHTEIYHFDVCVPKSLFPDIQDIHRPASLHLIGTSTCLFPEKFWMPPFALAVLCISP